MATFDEEKAEYGRGVVEHYAGTVGKGSGEDNQTLVADILADLMHFSAEIGVDFGSALTTAELHFNEERGL